MAKKYETRWVAEWYTKAAHTNAMQGDEFNPDKLRKSSRVCGNRGEAEKLSGEMDYLGEARITLEEFNGFAWSPIERYVCGEMVR